MSGLLGFVRKSAPIFGSSPVGHGAFVRRSSSFRQEAFSNSDPLEWRREAERNHLSSSLLKVYRLAAAESNGAPM
jgi:hypothetical protein